MNYLKKIQETRKDKDIGQKEIAYRLGITQQQYSLYETGVRKLPAEMIPEICRALNVTPNYIYGVKTRLPKEPTIAEIQRGNAVRSRQIRMEQLQAQKLEIDLD